MMRRIVSVWLIDWPVAVWSRAERRTRPRASPPDVPPGHPFALIQRTARGAVIHALNPAARRAGLSRGQTQADALAMTPDLACRPADPTADARALHALAGWCERWSPSVSLDPSPEGLEGLILDVTGAAHLFGGERALLSAMRSRLLDADVPARLAMASTTGAAWAVARYGDPDVPEHVVPPEDTREALSALPIEALRLDDRLVAQSRRLGLKRIGDLYAMPRSGLARRFRGEDGMGLVARLDQALGQASEAGTPVRAPPRFRAFEAYAEPICDSAGIEARLPGLLDRLAAELEAYGQGARRLTVTAFRTDGEAPGLEVRLGRPGRQSRVWLRLFREKGLDRIDPGFGVDALMVSADETGDLDPRQTEMHGGSAAVDEKAAALIDRLSARLGESRVLAPRTVGSWMPERAERLLPVLETPETQIEAPSDARSRPTLLLDPPEPVTAAAAEVPHGPPARFTWRRVSRRVRRAEGPERLSPEWWRPRPDDRLARTRDYYRVEDEAGVSYWLFREGLYGAEYSGGEDEREPSWWMHGIFS